MKLRYDPNLDYQVEAVNAVAELFAGQPYVEAGARQDPGAWQSGAGMFVVGNRLDLPPEQLQANLHEVQAGQSLFADDALRTITQDVHLGALDGPVTFYNYAVEMETGTGKTYVYLRTALELARRYGLRKYIIVVPSVAIREGVLSALRGTYDHLSALFGGQPYGYGVYDSANLGRVKAFSESRQVDILVMTLQSFNTEDNVIRRAADRFMGLEPIRQLQAVRPVLILDEPQNMESENSIAALAALNPLMALRYSATHRDPYNLVYRLTPAEAHRRRIVKTVRVAGARLADADDLPYIQVNAIRSGKKTIEASLRLSVLDSDGAINLKTVTVRPGARLEELTHRSLYAGLRVEELDLGAGVVRLSRGVTIPVGEAVGDYHEAIFQAQIEETVARHLRKQEEVRGRGIKVLSLFFIDRVANYWMEDGQTQAPLIRRLFDEAYERLKAGYEAWRDLSAQDVQAGYFASSSKTSLNPVDTGGTSQRDRDAYDLIMRDKERLLSFDDPHAFIFTHSALREGWDNPNVFQICTLNQTVSTARKRQEIGRGVRIPVDQQGQRVFDERLNVLTVVANQSYRAFVAEYHDEVLAASRTQIQAHYGVPPEELSEAQREEAARLYGAEAAPAPEDARDEIRVTLRSERYESADFQALWNAIAAKARYRVRIDTEALVSRVLARYAELRVSAPQVVVEYGHLIGEDGKPGLQSGEGTTVTVGPPRERPNLLLLVSEMLAASTPPLRITRRTILRILQSLPEAIREGMAVNPTAFATALTRVLAEELRREMVHEISYVPTGEAWDRAKLEESFERLQRALEPSAGKALYDHVDVDSEIERQVARALEAHERVRLYLKLPRWFQVATPYGGYAPDWAILVERDGGADCVKLIRETKASASSEDLRGREAAAIACGREHFRALGVEYAVATGPESLRLEG